MSKIDVDNRIAAGMSLANHASRRLIASGSPIAQIIESPRTRHANLLRKPSVILIGKSRRRFQALYAVNQKATATLFRNPAPTPEIMRGHWREHARVWVFFEVSRDGGICILETAGTVRGTRELLRAFAPPLTTAEQGQLRALLVGSVRPCS